MSKQDPPSRRAAPNALRGAAAAFVLGLVGFLIPIVAGLSFTVVRWWVSGFSEWDRAHDLRLLPFQLAYPTIGTAFVLASAGWATYAPRGTHRFTPTLAVVSAIALVSWIVIALGASDPDRMHAPLGMTEQLVEPSALLFLAAPPMAAAIILTTWRNRRAGGPGARRESDPV
jgi:hypothetical protein